MRNIFALEGPSGIWKTTLASQLHKRWSAHRVGEYFHYISAWEEYPGIAPQTDIELQKIRSQLYTLLQRRELDILQAPIRSPIITERSPLTLLYTEAVRIHSWLLWDLPSLSSELLALLESVHQPDYYIFLEVHYLTAVARLQTRQNPHYNFFYQPDTILNIQKLITFFVETYLHDWEYSIVYNDWDMDTALDEITWILATANPITCNALTLLCRDIQKWLDLVKQI